MQSWSPSLEPGSIRTDRWRYNRWKNSGEELYDHQADPHEFTNLADDAQYDNVLKQMRQLLRKIHQQGER
jgi:iduronate 2-sulfatase